MEALLHTDLMSDLSFGIHYSCQSPEREWERIYRATIQQVQEAEALGFESISVAEHHFLPDGWIPTPMTFLGALAAVTQEIKLTTNIVILPLHHPITVAEQAAVLDLVSGGDFRLGVSIGWRDEEFDAFSVEKSERVARVEEGIELIRLLLTEESVTYEGDIYTVEDLTLMPRPVQESLPIWYGGQSKPAIDRAAQMADVWSMSPIETRNELAEKVDVYNDALKRHDQPLDEVHRPLRREAYIAEDDETAWEEVGPALLYEYEDVYGDYGEIGHEFITEDTESAIEELRDHAENRFIIGGPETAIEELSEYRETIDMDEVLLRMHFPGLDPMKSEKSMRIIAEDVMPYFKT
jgi:probable F420-dependent oxidoreductase